MAQAGVDELELVVREHSRLVYRVVYSVLRNHHDAEDATQETFVRVLRYRRKLPDVRDQRTWLARIAWRVAIDRKSRREAELDEPEVRLGRLRSAAAAADDTAIGSQTSLILESLIARLPPKLRDPLTLSTLQEMSPVDVAQVLGINEAAVRSRIFRARKILRERFAALTGENHAVQR